jgi:ATP-dependent Clp protease protease subunit
MTEEGPSNDNTALWLDVKSRFVLKDEIDLDNRVLIVNGGISLKSYVKFDKQLRLLEAIHTDPVLVIINSPGGSVYDGFAFVDRILNSTCIINTQGMGMVASAALPIFLSGDKRTSGKHTTFMHHPPAYATNHENITIHGAELTHTKNLATKINKFLASRTNKPYSFWSSVGKNTDYYFDTEQAIDLGVVHDYL